MLTENEAKTKTKICPLMRYVANPHGVVQDKDQPFYEQSQCQASACMAWRFDRPEYEHGEPLPFGMVPADPGWEKDGETWYCGPGVAGEKRQCWRKPLPRTGNCGAFGRPA